MTGCPYFDAKGMHLYVGYRVKATGAEDQMCHGCGGCCQPERNKTMSDYIVNVLQNADILFRERAAAETRGED